MDVMIPGKKLDVNNEDMWGRCCICEAVVRTSRKEIIEIGSQCPYCGQASILFHSANTNRGSFLKLKYDQFFSNQMAVVRNLGKKEKETEEKEPIIHRDWVEPVLSHHKKKSEEEPTWKWDNDKRMYVEVNEMDSIWEEG